MAHQDIPIRFRFLKIPVTWEVKVDSKSETLFCGRLQHWDSPKQIKVAELDGWEWRDRFFGLKENDVAGLAKFLNCVGVWSSDPEVPALAHWSRNPLYADPNEIWQFREVLKDGLSSAHRKNWVSQLAPLLPRPQTLLDLVTPNPANDFPLRFELADVVAGVVTITNARRMLFATVLADVARGIRFKTCKRQDCKKPFPIQSRHKQEYCTQYCGHLASQRRKRAAEQKRRRAENRRKKSLR